MRLAIIAAALALATSAHAAGYVLHCPASNTENPVDLFMSDNVDGEADTGDKKVELSYVSGDYVKGNVLFAGKNVSYLLTPVKGFAHFWLVARVTPKGVDKLECWLP